MSLPAALMMTPVVGTSTDITPMLTGSVFGSSSMAYSTCSLSVWCLQDQCGDTTDLATIALSAVL